MRNLSCAHGGTAAEGGIDGVKRDQNLLFGILAVQLRRVTPAQLVEAAAVWAADPSESLGARLVHIGALKERDRAFLDDFVNRAVAEHGGDAAKTLQSFGGDRQVAATFHDSIVLTDGGGVQTAQGLAPTLHYQEVTAVSAVQETPGRYTHVSEYGRGGMGRVLLVHDAFIGRQVALKELLPDLSGNGDTPATPGSRYMGYLGRFLQEARVTGQLEHPSIVPVYELGRRDDDTLYYTMKLVRGKTLREALREAADLPSRLALLPHVIDLCQAMAYAHSRRVIHRDIKPANVMVGEFGETVVLDWGLAKSLDAEDAHAEELAETMQLLQAGDLDKAAETAYGAVMGTPAYMPPEQARGEIDRVDARSDIYALGVVLYELLTGNTPFTGVSVQEVLRKVREDEPRPAKFLEPNAPPELAAIAMRAMAKVPGQRYASTKELADDLLRFQAGAMVDAYDYKAVEYLRRFVGRHKAVLSTAAAALVVLLGFGVYSYASILDARDIAEYERQEALVAKTESDRQRDLAEEQRERAESMAIAIERAGYAPSVLRAQHRVRNNMLTGAREQLKNTPGHLRSWEWGYLWTAMDRSALTLTGHTHSVLHASFSPDGGRIVTGSRDRTAIVWDARTGGELRVFRGHADWVWSAAFCPAGERIVTASWDNTVRVWDAETGEELLAPLEHSGWVASAVFSPDGTRILTAGMDHTARLWDATTGALEGAMTGHDEYIEHASFSPDGTRIVTASWDQTARVWDAATGEALLVLEGHENVLWSAAFSPGGARVVTGSHDRTAKVWDARTGEEISSLEGHAGYIPAVAFSPDGNTVLTSSWDRTARLWDAESGELAEVFTGHGRMIRSAAFHPEGGRVVTASEDGTAKVWEVPGAGSQRLLEGEWYADLSPDGAAVIAWTDEDTASLWDVASRERVHRLTGHDDKIWSAAFDPDGARIVTASEDGSARLWDADTGEELQRFAADDTPLRSAAFAPCGLRIATGGEDGMLRAWDIAAEREEFAVRAHNDRLRFIRFSPDGERILTSSSDHTAKLWDAATGSMLHTLPGHEDEVRMAVFNHDGSRVVTASNDRTARIFDGRTGELLHILDGHADMVLHAAFSPDGARLVTGAMDTTVKMWDAGTGDELVSLEESDQWVGFVAFDPGGMSILACSGDGRAHEWHAAPWWPDAWEDAAQRAAIAPHAMRLAPRWTRVTVFHTPEADEDLLERSLRSESGLGLFVHTAEPVELLPGVSLKQGDLLVRIDGRTPRAPRDLAEALQRFLEAGSFEPNESHTLRLQILHGYSHRAYEVRLEGGS